MIDPEEWREDYVFWFNQSLQAEANLPVSEEEPRCLAMIEIVDAASSNKGSSRSVQCEYASGGKV